MLTATDGSGDVTTNAYSGTGQLCWTYLGSSGNGCSSPPAEATVYTYDANGNLVTTTKPSGQTITNAYNAANRLCWTYQGVVSNPSCGSPPTSGTYAVFTYDPDGRVLTMTDPTGTSTWSYNAQGQELTSTNGAGAEVQYGYDLNGNQTSITYPTGGIVVSQAFNSANQVCWTDVSTSISGNGCSSPPSGSTVYSYDANGNLLGEDDLPSGVDSTYIYDGDNNISAISDKTQGGSTVFAAAYTRNGDNLVTADGSQPAGVGEYNYTAKNQVCYAASGNTTACASPPSGSYDYGYDLAGNLVNDNSTAQTFNSQDELCWSLAGSSSSPCSSPPTGATTYAYDANGDRTATMPATGAAATYSYNAAGQLTQYQPGSGTPTTYAYNGHGLRMGEATGSSTTAFSWSDTGTVPLLLQETTGAGTTSYVYGPTGSPIEEILPSGNAYYYSSDDLGSTRALTDASGNVQDTDTYDPYGNLTATIGSVQDHLLYAGQYLDSENGLYYLRARYYDSSTGQFLTVDPEVATTMEPYAYAQEDPVNTTDPTGDCGIDIFQSCDPRCPASVQPLGPWQCAAAYGVVRLVKGEGASGLCSDLTGSLVFHVKGVQKCVVYSDEGTAVLTTTFNGYGPYIFSGGVSVFAGNTDNLSAYGGPFSASVYTLDVYFGTTFSFSSAHGVTADTVGLSGGTPGMWWGTTTTSVQWLRRS